MEFEFYDVTDKYFNLCQKFASLSRYKFMVSKILCYRESDNVRLFIPESDLNRSWNNMIGTFAEDKFPEDRRILFLVEGIVPIGVLYYNMVKIPILVGFTKWPNIYYHPDKRSKVDLPRLQNYYRHGSDVIYKNKLIPIIKPTLTWSCMSSIIENGTISMRITGSEKFVVPKHRIDLMNLYKDAFLLGLDVKKYSKLQSEETYQDLVDEISIQILFTPRVF